MKRLLALLPMLFALVGCGVKIQTGHEDPQRQEEVADYRAKEIRSEWGDRIQKASPLEKANLYKTLVDSVGASYVRYGQGVAEDWRNANQQNATPVTDAQMREVVSRSNQSQRAIFQAYEDVLEHALGEIKVAAFFDQTTIQLLEQYADQFYKLNSTVFFPSGTVERYEGEVENMRATSERLSSDIGMDLRRY